MIIPKFKLRFDRRFVKKMQKGVKEILTSGRPLSNSKYCIEFAYNFLYTFMDKYQFALAVGSGTDALELALRGCNAEGKTVIISDNTMVAQPLAIEKIGGKFQLVDIDLTTLSMDYYELRKKIRGKNIGAVILTHIGGLVSKDIQAIAELCKIYDIPLIEDCCHALGSPNIGYGDILCFSFFSTKVMTTCEGGLVVTRNTEYHNKMLQLRQFGWDSTNTSVIPGGGNMKMTEIQAYMGLLELKRVKQRIKRRREINEIYFNNLSPAFYTVYKQEGCPYYKTIVLIPTLERDKIIKYCNTCGVTMTGFVYDPPVHKQPIYKKKQKYFNSDFFSKHHLCPPNYPELTDEEVEYICKVMNEAIKGGSWACFYAKWAAKYMQDELYSSATEDLGKASDYLTQSTAHLNTVSALMKGQ